MSGLDPKKGKERRLHPEHRPRPSLLVGVADIGGISSQRLTQLAFQGKHDEAEPVYMRAIAIGEKALGPDHPFAAKSLNNRALTLAEQVGAMRGFRLSCVRIPICRRCLDSVVSSSPNLGTQGRLGEAVLLNERTQAVRDRLLTPENPRLPK